MDPVLSVDPLEPGSEILPVKLAMRIHNLTRGDMYTRSMGTGEILISTSFYPINGTFYKLIL